MKKICFVVSTYPRNKDDNEVPWLRKIVSLIRSKQYDIKIFAPAFRGLTTHKIDGCDVKRYRYSIASLETLTHDEGAPNKVHRFHYKVLAFFYILFGTIFLTLFHRKQRFSILHIHWPFPHAIFGFIAALFRKTKIIINFHGADLLLVNKYPWTRIFLRFFIKHADAIVVNSTFTSDLVTSIYKSNVHIIPFGAAVNPPTQIPKLEQNFHILSLGRCIERKGLCYLIQAMPKILTMWPKAQLTIAGGGPMIPSLQELIDKLALVDSVSLLGKVDQKVKEELFATCHTFVLPAIIDSKGDTEGLGVVLIEAMTYAKPVIASNVGGIPDLIIHEKTGLLCEQKNPDAIVTAVNSVFSNYSLAEALGNSGLGHIQKNFSWESVIQKTEKLYHQIL